MVGLRLPVASGDVVRTAGRLAADLARVAVGTDDLRPAPKDARFADDTWTRHPLYRRWAQAYVAVSGAADRLLDTAERDTDWRDLERARFLVGLLTSALAPTNTLLGNPAALKAAFDTGGRSLLDGLSNLVTDVVQHGGLPSQTDRTAYAVGVDLGISAGQVVWRSEVAELLHYAPATNTVRSRPVVVVPPPIGRFYFLDLRPGRSFVEHAVGSGLQVLLLSWRNPQAEHADWDIDTYATAIREAVEVAKQITGSPDVNTLGFCAGGILQSLVLNAEAATGEQSIASASYAVTLLDFDERAPLGAFSMPWLLEMAGWLSARRGVITARSLATVFSLMRPDDLIFNYLVKGWLMGQPPPVFDILAWNADGTNLPARLHRQFLSVFRDNALGRPGTMTALGHPVDLSQVTVPTFVTGAVTDHLTPWQGCYRTTRLLSGPSTFVLSNAGHVASLVNPPGNPKASYFAGGPDAESAQEWLDGAERQSGSWWEAWTAWVLERSGQEQPAPTGLGSAAWPVLEPAPGSYVVDREVLPAG